MADETPAAEEDAAPLSLARLQDAFAQMLGSPAEAADAVAPAPADDAVTPEGIVEAMLFVGRPGGAALTAEEIAEAIRDVSPGEVHEIAERLEAGYRRDGAACRVERSEAGYRLTLADGLERVADRLRGKVRAARLSQQAIETLAVVAYRQPIAPDDVEQLRGQKCAATLSQLLRLGLVAADESTEDDSPQKLVTTDRFLRAFQLASVEQLPRVAELDD